VNTAFQSAIVYFKRGSRSELVRDSRKSSLDEEKTPAGSISAEEKVENQKAEIEKAAADAPPMQDIFSWQHMYYTVPISGESDRTLLDDVSGFVAPGKLTALMGESGAGKTTLLNVLAERVKTGVIRGDRFVNGLPLPGDFQAQTGYCQQMDTHEGTSTVREALLFSANLRQPPETPRAEKAA
jgi:ATP-binding cassette subfamily G (WHITE) protein 2 (SNQ2)